MNRIWVAIGLFGCATLGWGQATASRDLFVTAGKSVIVETPNIIERVSVANGDLAEAIVINPQEILVNGRTPGETSLVLWQDNGDRLFFDLTVARNENPVDAVRRELAREEGMQAVTIDRTDENIFIRGTVPDMTTAARAALIAGTLGDTVNLLRVQVPNTDAQILLKVRFADVDRSTTQQLGVNIFSNGATNTIGTISTGQFQGAQVGGGSSGSLSQGNLLRLQNALNVFLFRPDINLGATIQALAQRNLLQILAEPNVLALNGHSASFLSGGEFPYPTLQGGGGGLGAVTIQFRQFGIRINFTPTVTPRGTIRLQVAPEVSQLDYANSLSFNGFNIPALTTRRVQTEIELEDGQSFAIGGLLDNRDTEVLSQIPGLSNIPFFGKLFRSRQINKNNTELLVLVTPEIVRPIPADREPPTINFPSEFLPPNTSSTPPRTPGVDQTGPVPPSSPYGAIPVEELSRIMQEEQGEQQGTPQQLQPQGMLSLPPAPAIDTLSQPPTAQPQQ